MLLYQPRDKAEMFMPLISEQYSAVATNSIRLSGWPWSNHWDYASKPKTVVNLGGVGKNHRRRKLYRSGLKKKQHPFPLWHINELQSSDLLCVSTESAGLLSWDHNSMRYQGHPESDIWTMEIRQSVLILVTLLFHETGTSMWATHIKNQMCLLTWNSDAVTFMLVESWEFPRFFSSWFPILFHEMVFTGIDGSTGKFHQKRAVVLFQTHSHFAPKNLSVRRFTTTDLEYMWARLCSP